MTFPKPKTFIWIFETGRTVEIEIEIDRRRERQRGREIDIN